MQVESKRKGVSLRCVVDCCSHYNPPLLPRMAPNCHPAVLSHACQPRSCYASYVRKPPCSRSGGCGFYVRILYHPATGDCRARIRSHHFRRTRGSPLPSWPASLANYRAYRSRSRSRGGTCSHPIWFYSRSRLYHGRDWHPPASPNGRRYQYIPADRPDKGRDTFTRSGERPRANEQIVNEQAVTFEKIAPKKKQAGYIAPYRGGHG